MYHLLRTSSRCDGTPEGTWSPGDPFTVESAAVASEMLRNGLAILAPGQEPPPERPADPARDRANPRALERAAFGPGETPERSEPWLDSALRARARDGGA